MACTFKSIHIVNDRKHEKAKSAPNVTVQPEKGIGLLCFKASY